MDHEGHGRDYDYPTIFTVDKMARHVMNNFHKDDKIVVQGKLTTRADRNGGKRTDVFATRIEAANGKKKCYLE